MKYVGTAGLVLLLVMAGYGLRNENLPHPHDAARPAAPRVERAALAAAPSPNSAKAVVPLAFTANDVLDPEAMGNARNRALYALTQAGPVALNALREIATTPLPRAPQRLEFEVSLRITAFEAIDDLAAQGVDVGDAFSRALTVYKEPALQTLALVGLQGIEEGRPGKIGRFIKQLVD